MAEGGDGDFYEDFVRGEGGGGGDGVDFVGGVELAVGSVRVRTLESEGAGGSTSTTCAASMVSGMPSMPMMLGVWGGRCFAESLRVRCDLAGAVCVYQLSQARECRRRGGNCLGQ